MLYRNLVIDILSIKYLDLPPNKNLDFLLIKYLDFLSIKFKSKHKNFLLKIFSPSIGIF